MPKPSHFVRRSSIACVLFGTLVFSLLLAAAPVLSQDEDAAAEAKPAPTVPSWTEGLRTLQVKDALLDEGMAYYLTQGDNTQVTVAMQDRFARVVAQTSSAGGYLIGPFDVDELEEGESPLMAGAIRIPAASLRSNTSIDRMLASEMVFDAANHPDLTFLLTGSELKSRGDGELPDSTRFELLLEGTLGFKGQAVPVETEAELTLYLTSNETFNRGVGDFARLEGAFELTAEQLGLNPRVAGMLGPQAKVSFLLLFTTTDPERPIIPPSTPAAFSLESRYLTSLRDYDDTVQAFQAGEELIAAAWDDAEALRTFASSAVFDAGDGRRLLGQAKRAAERAVALGGDTPDPFALNVLARISAEVGEMQAAVDQQKRAIALATSGRAARAKASMEANLALYEELAKAAAASKAGN